MRSNNHITNNNDDCNYDDGKRNNKKIYFPIGVQTQQSITKSALVHVTNKQNHEMKRTHYKTT